MTKGTKAVYILEQVLIFLFNPFFKKNWIFQSFKWQDTRLFQLGISVHFLGALEIIARPCQFGALVLCTCKLASTYTAKMNVGSLQPCSILVGGSMLCSFLVVFFFFFFFLFPFLSFLFLFSPFLFSFLRNARMSQNLGKEVHLDLASNLHLTQKSWSSLSPLKSCSLFPACIDIYNIY